LCKALGEDEDEDEDEEGREGGIGREWVMNE